MLEKIAAAALWSSLDEVRSTLAEKGTELGGRGLITWTDGLGAADPAT
jgi:hypothetical protein